MPHSNFVIWEILFKIVVGVTIAVMWDYRPTTILLPLVIILLSALSWMNVFLKYDCSSLVFYWVCAILYIIYTFIYYLEQFWILAMLFNWLNILTIVISVAVLPAMNILMNPTMVRKVYI